MTERMIGSGSLGSAIAEIGGWGPFFAVRLHSAQESPPLPWRPGRDWLDDPDVLADQVAGVRAHLAAGGGAVPVRVAASAAQFGLVARLVSPALALAVHSARFLAVGPDDVWWQPVPGGMFPLSVTGRVTEAPDELMAHLAPLVEAIRGFSVPERIGWGNVASAVNGAATVIGRARPDLAGRAAAVAEALMALPPLRGTGSRRPDGRFRRRSCCLIYRASPIGRGAVCADCVLAAE